MTRLVLISLFLISSCIGEPPKIQDTVGAVRRFEPLVVTVEDSERIEAICRALSSKEDLLSVLVSTGTEYKFSYSQKNCSDRQSSIPKDVVTTIQKTDLGYVFRPTNGEAFGFSDVETVSKGVMSQICQNLGNLMSPMQISRTGAVWFTSFTSSEYCQSDDKGLCIHLQRGTVLDDINYEIHTNEWIKFKIANDKRGFFVERKLISSGDCSKGTIEKRAVLK
jgi:hypothetical protein